MFISRRSWTRTSNFKRRFRFRFRFNPAVIARLLMKSSQKKQSTPAIDFISTYLGIMQFLEEYEHIRRLHSLYMQKKRNQDIHQALEFSGDDEGGYSFGLFSVKFSNHGRELVAGSSDDLIYVYDVEANKLSLLIQAHTSDVNSVCFADEASHLIYSGSDDNLCKVWDRRCFRSKGKPAGILMGHLEEITFLDTRGDGRYFISNGKDQTIKLWDIRKNVL